MNLEQRTAKLHEIAGLMPNAAQMHRMIGLVTFAFGKNSRKNGGHYLDHVIEVFEDTIRLLARQSSRTHIGGIVSLGHDLREDKAEMFGGLQSLDRLIGKEFGDDALRLITLLTNPIFTPGLLLETKHELYRKHVLEFALSDVISAAVKLADYLSNTGNLKRLMTDDAEKALRLAKKYKPLFPDFKRIALNYADPENTLERLAANETVADTILAAA